MSRSLQAEPARPDELALAFRLIFRHVEEDERETRVANALDLVAQGELDPAGVLVVRQRKSLLGAIICQPAPGGCGLIWPPQVGPGPEHVAVEDCLVRHATDWLRQRGARLGQALLAAADIPLAVPLERNDFTHVTSLLYLRHDLDLPTNVTHCQESLDFQTYAKADRALFHEALLSTYEQTLDCPEVNDVRSIDEIIAGHKAQGSHDPERWWLAFDKGRPVGTLLLAQLSGSNTWDLSYVGVVPNARSRGIGHQLVRKALYEAWAGKAAQLTLTVDARNHPARNLYRALGFELYDQRDVFLATWKAVC